MRAIYSKAPVQFKGDLHLLNPALFKKLISNGSMAASSALEALPRILCKIQLRRFLGMEIETVGGETIIIGADIPAFEIRTVECDAELYNMALYEAAFRTIAPTLKCNYGPNDKQTDDSEVGGKFDMSIYRRLRHLAFSYSLEDLFLHQAHREGNLASDIRTWREKPGGGLF
ncbi:hypothetical protein PHISP_05583 [Aspergillus sp. HF37]|nr:hypothetical protein PHISP_05583 [Aspergillus sp. HF37]